LHDLPNDDRTLIWKAYSVIAPSFVGRGVEVIDVMFEHVKKIIPAPSSSAGAKSHYIVEFSHKKQPGMQSSDPQTAFVTGDIEVKALDQYIACFSVPQRQGVNTQTNIGK